MRTQLPHRATLAELEATLVGRQALATQLEDDFRATAQQGAARYALVLGARGEGKSHLLALLARRLSHQEGFTTIYLPTLRTDSIAGLLANVLAAMPKQDALPSPQRQLQQLWGLPADEATRRALRMLEGRLAQQGLVMVLDELERLFSSLKAADLARLRAILQEHARWSILGATRSQSSVFTDRSQPFFSTFSTHPLPPLSPTQSTALLQKLGLSDIPAWAWDYLQQTGGSPLAVTRLAERLLLGDTDQGEGQLNGIAERHWGELQQLVDTLSAGQQAAVYPLLCASRPMPVKEIADRTFQTPQATSTHLRRMAKQGLLRSTAKGKERLYELAEPLARFSVRWLADAHQ